MNFVKSFLSPETLLFVMILCMASIYALRNNSIYRLLLHPYSIEKKKEFHRLITAGFVHNDYAQLLINSLTLIFTGPFLRKSLPNGIPGTLEWLLIYLGSCVAANLLCYLYNRKDFYYSSCGASGAIMGCMYAYLYLHPFEKALTIMFVVLPNFITIPLWSLLMLRLLKKYKTSRVDDLMHLSGALAGLLITMLLSYQINGKDNEKAGINPAACYHHSRQLGPVAADIPPITAPTPPNKLPTEVDTAIDTAQGVEPPSSSFNSSSVITFIVKNFGSFPLLGINVNLQKCPGRC
ncbi:rhomboid family intramembrane serine protease [Pedobacter sp. HMF7647]|uniref:Rhomboid family intramembrane serine protease n=1 Tax=Hufsiella arboris TaxID=2695275 RepID=A0A7K1Y5T1_9SPHI|nr:rhomboid family intramembrane serine protease [Hufsiella arboris]MXV49936.1 rhomboid family intramembrane serine protease [Hufsiella arboris]